MDPLQAKANFNRICQLLIDKGSDALRRALHVMHPAPTLAAALHSHRKTLQRLRYNVINPPQWRLLYPAGPPNSNDFDITLLTILLRNICGLPSPATGWKVKPPSTDTSISADILRIKIFRNEVYGHTASAQYDDATFKKFWQEISQTLVKLGIPQQEIDELKVAPLSPEEKSYIEKLKEWKELEDILLEKMKDFETKMVDVKAEIKKLKGPLRSSNISNVDQHPKLDFKGKIDCLCKKFQVNTRQWFFDELSRWFADEESRVMILTAGPGMGKSVLSAMVCQQYRQRGQLAGCHFCDFRKSNSGNPLTILESLASQMCDNVYGFCEKLDGILRRYHFRESLSDAFRVLLSEPLHALDRHEPMLIVLDALDESKTDDKSEFLELISDEFPHLPVWVKILITSRPELQVKKKLEHFNPLEILPHDDNQQKDLKCFVKGNLPHFEVDSIDHLVSLCQSSFLYAYYMVKELKEVDAGIEPNFRDYAPKGISGFYEKQFKRLKTGLQPHDPGILNAFVNVVAASSGTHLPIEILLKCMNLSDEKYIIRNTIINKMSEILPVHDNCLTVYHTSLTDWFTLEGDKEHEFVADVNDGTKRLWTVCESIYRDIDFTKSVSNFELSRERKFALENGGKYLVNVGDTVDFHWLVNVRLNALKFRFCGDLNVDYYRILNIYKSAPSDELYWSIFQHYILDHEVSIKLYGDEFNRKRDSYVLYLQSLANGHFDFVKKNLSSQNTARDILVEENEMWLEDVVNVKNSNYEVISNAFLRDSFRDSVCSPDKKLVVLQMFDDDTVKVFELPRLTMIFEIQVSRNPFSHLTFSPDSSYFLCGSIRSCVCIRKQKEVAFIPGGPEDIKHYSFSSCGKKLVTAEEKFLKVWDVEKRELLVQVEKRSDDLDHYYFSSCNKYILDLRLPKVVVRDSATLKVFLTMDHPSCEECLGSNQITYLVDDRISVTSYYHFSDNEAVGIAPAEPFTWKNRRCQIWSHSSTLIIYDFINREVIDRFQIDCLRAFPHIHSISKLDGTNFLFCLEEKQLIILSLETPEESSVVSYAFPDTLPRVTLSPDHVHVACCYDKYNVLTIRSVDNGETLETVELQKPPKACWWSDLYLWVFCEGEVIRFPYYSTHSKALGSGRAVCPLTSTMILGFGEGVIVFRGNDNMITILKISDNMPFVQKIVDRPFSEAAISKDGCAVLLYNTTEDDTTYLQYQLWEFTPESKWAFHLDGTIRTEFCKPPVLWMSLTGTQNCRELMWVGLNEFSGLALFFFDFTSRKLNLDLLHVSSAITKDAQVIDVTPNFLLIRTCANLHVLDLSDRRIKATLSFCSYDGKFIPDIFYLSSKGLLIAVWKDAIKCFKIHNIENCLSHNRFLT